MPGEKLTSIVLLAFNEIEYTKLCIESIFRHTSVPFELVLVDNGSTDGTGEYFDTISGAKVIKNKENLGFAKGCNQGVESSSGDYVLLLNNDTIVTENWLDNLIYCMEGNPEIGLVGPVSNFVAGEQQIEVPYGSSIEEMQVFARQFNRRDTSKYVETNHLIGFCLLIRRSVIERVGLLDERFGLGNFEDNDYCTRAMLAGFKLVRAGDTFIHHFGNRTFIGNSIDWHSLMEGNWEIFKSKWEQHEEVTSHDLTLAKITLLGIKDSIVHKDPVEDYADRYMQTPWRYPDKFVNSPTLSLAMIVKNEEDNIGRCLESVKDVVDEIIVVDTGSTDRTVEIAKSYNAKVFFHQWKNNFAEARNVSLEHATGDWVMFLDADEELVAEDAPKLKELLEDTVNEGFYFNLLSFVGDKEDDGAAVANVAFRLWRNKTKYRFAGALHEQILAAIQSSNPNIGFSGVRLNHYGYLNKVTEEKDKVQRNLSILLDQVTQHPNDPFIRFNLGVEYLRLKDYEAALVQYQRAFKNLSGLDVAYASMLIRNIAFCLKELGKYDEALKVLKDAKEAYPDYTDLFYLEGLIYLDKKDFMAAIRSFEFCLEMGPAGNLHISQVGVGGNMAAYSLARAYRAIGNEREAVAAYKKALEHNRRDHLALSELGLLLVHREKLDDTRRFLEPLADLRSDNILFALSFIYSQGRYYEVSLGFLDELVKDSSNPSRAFLLRGECLLNLKRYQEAVGDLNNVSRSSQFYPAASVDKAICYVLMGKNEDAMRAIDVIKDHKDFRIIYRVYRYFAEAVADQEKPSEEKSDYSLRDIDDTDKEQAFRVTSDLLKKLLELEEYDFFERAIGLLGEVGLSSGEKSLYLGKVYYDVGYTDMAVEELIRAYEGGYADGEAFFILGKAAFEGGFFEEAKMFLLEAQNLGVEEINLYISLGRILIKLKEVGKAIEILDIGAEKYPDSPLIAEIKQSIRALA